eukprot:383717_1
MFHIFVLVLLQISLHECTTVLKGCDNGNCMDGDNDEPLKQIIENTYKNKEIGNEIYSKLLEMEIGLEELLLTDDNDLNDLCNNMNLKGSNKIKFKALIRKQKQLNNPTSNKHFITISKTEQHEINKIDMTLKQLQNLSQLLDIHSNEIEHHANKIILKVNQQFEEIFKILKIRQKILTDKITEWKMEKLQNVSNEMANIVRSSDAFHRLQQKIDILLLNDKFTMEQREKELLNISHELFENDMYYLLFNDINLLTQYLSQSTTLLDIDFEQMISLNELNAFGIVNANKTNIQNKLPSIVLSDIVKIEEYDEGYKIKLEWNLISNNNKKYKINNFNIKYKINNNNFEYDEKKKIR